jgi:hypothetical protein
VPQLVFAQSGVPSLPGAPVLTRLLLEEPLLLTGALIAVSVAIFFVFNSQGKVKKAVLWGGVGLAVSVGVLILANAVETDREKIIAATTPLVRVTAAADTSRLSPMLHDEVQLSNDQSLAADQLPHGQSWNKDQILTQVTKYLGGEMRLKPKETAIIQVDGVIDSPGRGRTQLQVRVVPELYEFPSISWWRIDWKQDQAGDWKVIGIQPLDVGLPGARR